MTTPIVMSLLLVAPYLLVRVFTRAGAVDSRAGDAGALGLTLLFIFAGAGHFLQTGAMAAMLPAWIPARVYWVQATGVLEIGLAVAFLPRRYRRASGWTAAIMLLLFFPVNVYAAIHRIPMGGHAWGPEYLFIRAPLQALILMWIYRFAILPESSFHRRAGSVFKKSDGEQSGRVAAPRSRQICSHR